MSEKKKPSEEKMWEMLQQIIGNQFDFFDDEIKKMILPTTNVINDIGADSLDLVEIIMEVENVFGVSIEDEDLEKMKTPQDLLDCIVKKLE
jgi:acyl carrier protein